MHQNKKSQEILILIHGPSMVYENNMTPIQACPDTPQIRNSTFESVTFDDTRIFNTVMTWITF